MDNYGLILVVNVMEKNKIETGVFLKSLSFMRNNAGRLAFVPGAMLLVKAINISSEAQDTFDIGVIGFSGLIGIVAFVIIDNILSHKV